MEKISELLEGVKTVGIAGHERPDGDCTGSCMGLYLYLKENYPYLDVDVYMETPKPQFSYIDHIEDVLTEEKKGKQYDLFFLLDICSKDRVGVVSECLDTAAKVCCIDHHVTTDSFADIVHIRSHIGSAAEVLYELFDEEKVSTAVATAIYTGIVHDTGVFQYAATSPRTLEIAGKLMKQGVEFSKIIEESFYQKSYQQNQLMGRVLTESILLLDGQVIAGVVRQKDMEFYQVSPMDLDGIVNQLRYTRGVKVAIFIYELDTMLFKVSLRSGPEVDVNKVASYFGGGGHVRAAGCKVNGTPYDVITNIATEIQKQLLEE